MSHSNGHHDEGSLPPEWTEAKLARLLERFFAAELEPPGVSVATPSLIAASPVRPTRSGAGRWVLPLCGLAVVACGWFLSQSPVLVTPLASNGLPPLAVEIEAAGMPFHTELVSFTGETGDFAQRNEWRQTTGGYLESQSGSWVEWTTEELAIEVEPVDQFEDDVRRE